MVLGKELRNSIPKPHDAATMETDRLPGPGGGQQEPLTLMEAFSVRIPKEYLVTLSGGLAGAASGIVSCPLDVIKTKLQAQGGFSRPKEGRRGAYRGVSGTARIIWGEEGVRGLYRGLGPMLLGYVPTWAVYLTVYNKTQRYFRTKTDNEFLANVYASLSGGACSTMATNPIWVIKTRLMSQSNTGGTSRDSKPPWHYNNTLDAFRKMYRNEGILSFYSGLTPALLGLTHVAIQFPLYEIFKARFTGLGRNQGEYSETKDSHFLGISLAVFLSKVIASTATYPHEVVRTRLQTQQRAHPDSQPGEVAFRSPKAGDYGRPPGGSSSDGMVNTLRYRGTIQTCKVILAEEGWRGFYAGLGTNLIRAVPSAMTTIVTFEYLKKTFFQYQRMGKAKLAVD